MRVLVTGANGQLGHDVMARLALRGHEAAGSGTRPARAGAFGPQRYIQLDITDRARTEAAISALRPDAVVHCAAWTDVDGAEEAGSLAAVRGVNVSGTENIACGCKAAGSKLVYISTDYVFDGSGSKPWQPDSSAAAPLNVYGQSKLDGERAVERELDRHYILRVGWLFGINGRNFVTAMLGAGRKSRSVTVVDDQIGTPTYTADLAGLIADMLEREAYGRYHAANGGGYISRYQFAKEIYRQAGISAEVLPVATAQYAPSKAARPLNGRLDCSKLAGCGFAPLPDWKDALARYLRELGRRGLP